MDPIRHAYTGHLYELLGDGTVQVTDPETGEQGIFDAQGDWLSGTLRTADFHMLRHVGGARAPEGGMFGGR